MKNSTIAAKLCTLFDQKITSFYRESYKGLVGKSQLEVLNYLHLNKKAKSQEIADSLSIPKQHASKILLKFEEENIVQCKVDETDKRAKIYTLTEEGLKLIETHLKVSNKNFDDLLEKLNAEEQQEFVEAMKIMLKLLAKM